MKTTDELTYNAIHAKKLDQMHRRNIKKLVRAGYPEKIIGIYRAYYIESKPMTRHEKMVIESITTFLTSKKITLCFV